MTFAGDVNHETSGSIATFTIAPAPVVGYNVCLLYDPTKVVKSGATIPLKIRLCSSTGANQSAPGLVVTAVSIGLVSGSTTSEVVDAGNANPDGKFRYDGTLGPGYIFNLKTTGLATGTYRLEIRVTGDPQPHYLFFQVR